MELFLIYITYKLSFSFIGFGFAYLGYKLFVKGVIEPASNFKGKWKEAEISITQAAPGIFFALFGCVLIVVALITAKPIKITSVGNDGEIEFQLEQTEQEETEDW